MTRSLMGFVDGKFHFPNDWQEMKRMRTRRKKKPENNNEIIKISFSNLDIT